MEGDSQTQTSTHADEKLDAYVNNTPVIIRGDTGPLNRDNWYTGREDQQNNTQQTNGEKNSYISKLHSDSLFFFHFCLILLSILICLCFTCSSTYVRRLGLFDLCGLECQACPVILRSAEEEEDARNNAPLKALKRWIILLPQPFKTSNTPRSLALIF